MSDPRKNFARDLWIIVFSVVIAVIFAKTGVLKNLLASAKELRFLGSFTAGIFFVSIFTAAPAMVVLADLARFGSAWEVALLGGVGALIGDLIIFRFIKDRLSEDFLNLIGESGSKRMLSLFRLKLFRWIVPLVGALIVASPLPDELGLAMMGLSKMKTSLFIPVSFLLNFLGILAIGLIAKAI